MLTRETPHSFACMGTEMAIWIDHSDAVLRQELFRTAERFLHDFDWRFTRFDAGSELCQVNADPAPVVNVSREFAEWLAAALWAADWSGGLVDPTLVDAIEQAGYRRSLGDGADSDGPADADAGNGTATLVEALKLLPALSAQSTVKTNQARVPAPVAAPIPTPAGPAVGAGWRQVVLDRATLQVARPHGVRFDAGGTGKGYAADRVAAMLAERLASGTRWFVDCGGDLRLSAVTAGDRPHTVLMQHPITGDHSHSLQVWGGAVATSSVNRRIWRNDDGSFGHHLIDPATGRPAWTGLLSVTAVGESALQAETLAKWALLAGPAKARELLAGRGGLLVQQSGAVEVAASRQVRQPIDHKEAA